MARFVLFRSREAFDEYVGYRRTCAKEAARHDPRIETAYDSLATVCEEAQAVPQRGDNRKAP